MRPALPVTRSLTAGDCTGATGIQPWPRPSAGIRAVRSPVLSSLRQLSEGGSVVADLTQDQGMVREREKPPDIEALVAELRAKVEERRRSGAYPPGLEDDLAAHFRRIVGTRHERQRNDLRAPLQRIHEALPLDSTRI